MEQNNINHDILEGAVGYISQIELPSGLVYDIHDADAIHDLKDLGLDYALNFKGILATKDELNALTNPQVGDIYHITDEDTEYIYIEKVGNEEDNTNASPTFEWEEFGSKFITYHMHRVYSEGELYNVSGANKESNVTASGNITIPDISKKNYYIKPVVTVDNTETGTENFSIIDSFNESDVASVPTELELVEINSPTIEAVQIPNVTASEDKQSSLITSAQVSIPNVTNAGSASTWNFSVSNGVLKITGANSIAPTLGQNLVASNITNNTTITTSKVTLGEKINVSKVTENKKKVASGNFAKVVNCLLNIKPINKMIKIALKSSETEVERSVYSGDEISIGTKQAAVLVEGKAQAQEWTFENAIVRTFGRANYPVEEVPTADVGYSDELITKYNEQN